MGPYGLWHTCPDEQSTNRKYHHKTLYALCLDQRTSEKMKYEYGNGQLNIRVVPRISPYNLIYALCLDQRENEIRIWEWSME